MPLEMEARALLAEETVVKLEEELGRCLRKIESLRLEVDHLSQEVDYHVEEKQELLSQRNACAESAERWEDRARKAEHELEDMRRRVVGY